MRNSALVVLLGIIAITAPVLTFAYVRRAHEQDVEGIQQLRAERDSTRARLAAATNAADSTRLADELSSREYYVTRRQDHVPWRQERLDAWWRPIGLPTISVTLGLILLLVGSVSLARARSRTT